MKKILIAGAHSYIGTSFESYLMQWPNHYQIETLETTNDAWKNSSFAGYDAVFHVAGIAHIKETKENAHLYYTVNRDLAVAVAKKAISEAVNQFIFLSSMSVYGMETGVITKDTVPMPKSNYGKSKLEAEHALKLYEDEKFRLAIVRPPMVYGEGCKGNYTLLEKVSKIAPIFPDIKNQRSMIDIENLNIYIKHLIDDESSGTFFPQDPEYCCTTQMVLTLARKNNRSITTTKLFNPLFQIFRPTIIKKVFGDLIYVDME